MTLQYSEGNGKKSNPILLFFYADCCIVFVTTYSLCTRQAHSFFYHTHSYNTHSYFLHYYMSTCNPTFTLTYHLIFDGITQSFYCNSWCCHRIVQSVVFGMIRKEPAAQVYCQGSLRFHYTHKVFFIKLKVIRLVLMMVISLQLKSIRLERSCF